MLLTSLMLSTEWMKLSCSLKTEGVVLTRKLRLLTGPCPSQLSRLFVSFFSLSPPRARHSVRAAAGAGPVGVGTQPAPARNFQFQLDLTRGGCSPHTEVGGEKNSSISWHSPHSPLWCRRCAVQGQSQTPGDETWEGSPRGKSRHLKRSHDQLHFYEFKRGKSSSWKKHSAGQLIVDSSEYHHQTTVWISERKFTIWLILPFLRSHARDTWPHQNTQEQNLLDTNLGRWHSGSQSCFFLHLM